MIRRALTSRLFATGLQSPSAWDAMADWSENWSSWQAPGHKWWSGHWGQSNWQWDEDRPRQLQAWEKRPFLEPSRNHAPSDAGFACAVLLDAALSFSHEAESEQRSGAAGAGQCLIIATITVMNDDLLVCHASELQVRMRKEVERTKGKGSGKESAQEHKGKSGKPAKGDAPQIVRSKAMLVSRASSQKSGEDVARCCKDPPSQCVV